MQRFLALLFVIVTFVGFILADGVVQWVEARRRVKSAGLASARPLDLGGVTIPRGLFAAPGRGRAAYVWSRGRLERLF